jgi:GxxExxY protein
MYKGRRLDSGYRLDVVFENSIILESKACENIEPIYEAQLLPYLKLSGLHLGLMLNFNMTVMRDGFKRIVRELAE